MTFKRKTVILPALALVGTLALAGCTPAGSEEPVPSPGDSSISTPSPSTTPTEDSGIGEPQEEIPSDGTEIPIDGTLLRDTVDEGDSIVYIFEGGATEVAALKPRFEEAGFIWNDAAGDSRLVLVSATNANLVIEVQDDGTFTYTLFKGE